MVHAHRDNVVQHIRQQHADKSVMLVRKPLTESKSLLANADFLALRAAAVRSSANAASPQNSSISLTASQPQKKLGWLYVSKGQLIVCLYDRKCFAVESIHVL